MNRSRGLPIFLLFTVFLSHCSNPGQFREGIPPSFICLTKPVVLPEGRVTNECGPESLAAVMNYWGAKVSVEEVSRAVYSPQHSGTFSHRLAPYARERGFVAQVKNGNLMLIKNAIHEQVPPLVMIDVSQAPDPLRSGSFHYFVVVGYSEQDGMVLCKYYGNQYYAIKYEEFENRWKRADHFYLELRRSMATDYFEEGETLYQKGDFPGALKRYQRSLEKESDHYLSHWGIGNCHLALGRLEEALKSYQKAYELNSYDPKVLNNLANIYAELKRNLAEAESLATKAVERYKESLERMRLTLAQGVDTGTLLRQRIKDTEFELVQAYGTLGQVRLWKKEYALAISSFQAALEGAPLIEFDFRARRLYEIGLAYRGLGNKVEARHYFGKALETVRDKGLKSKIEKVLAE